MSSMKPRRLRGVVACAAAVVATNTLAGPGPEDEPYGPPKDLRPSCEPVAYPADALLHGLQGTSRIRYVVGSSGRAEGLEVVAAAGATPTHRLLDDAAKAFLEGCRFEPGASGERASRQMDYVWRTGDVGRDRWVMVRAVDKEAPPDVLPQLADPESCDWPRWPAEVRTKVNADDLRLRLRVDEGGAVREATLLHASGQRVIDDEVRAAAMRCRFLPARQGGQAVAAWTQVLYPWLVGTRGIRFLPSSRAARPSPGASRADAGNAMDAAVAVRDDRACYRPEYPPEAMRNGEVGTVRLRIRIDGSGGVAESSVIASSGHPRLDEAARLAYLSCRFPDAAGKERIVEYTFVID